jgi:hypothetical protein
VAQALLGSAGYARYSARVFCTREEVRGCEALGKRGGTARVFQAPVPAVERCSVRCGRGFCVERCEIWRSKR